MLPPDRPEWVIVIRPEPSAVPAGRRVARLLKYAKRALGLTAVAVRDPSPSELAAATIPEQELTGGDDSDGGDVPGDRGHLRQV